MWHVKCDMLCRVNLLSKFQLPSFYSLWFMIFCRFGGKGWLTDKGVWRTALTTQGILKTKNLHHCRPKLAIHPFLTSGSWCFAMARTHTDLSTLWLNPPRRTSQWKSNQPFNICDAHLNTLIFIFLGTICPYIETRRDGWLQASFQNPSERLLALCCEIHPSTEHTWMVAHCKIHQFPSYFTMQ